jgi:hypothetical protein
MFHTLHEIMMKHKTLFLLFVPILQELGPLTYLKFKAKLIEVHQRKKKGKLHARDFSIVEVIKDTSKSVKEIEK